MFDAVTNEVFNLKAILMWTIHDFLAYGNICGCTTKGEFACPVCAIDTCSVWLPHSRKTSYMGHRRFLPPDHKWRSHAKAFDGTKEVRKPPIPSTGTEILETLQSVTNDWGKIPKGAAQVKKRKKPVEKPTGLMKMWKKKSMFFELPYWEVSFFKIRISYIILYLFSSS